jgi:hypothetical protein
MLSIKFLLSSYLRWGLSAKKLGALRAVATGVLPISPQMGFAFRK